MAAGQIATRVAPVTSSFFFPLLSFLYIYILFRRDWRDSFAKKDFVCLFVRLGGKEGKFGSKRGGGLGIRYYFKDGDSLNW